MHAPDSLFAGSIPVVYAQLLVPLIFEPYATDLAVRVAGRQPARVLEIAAGTGALTRELARALPPGAEVVATDLSPAMLEQAQAAGTERPVEWRPADAQRLPFPDGSFDAVACQFGVMFFPDRAGAFAEVRRVLRPHGAFLFNVWDRIEENAFPEAVMQAVRPLLSADQEPFMTRLPHGYFDPAVITRDLARAGFTAPTVERVARRSHADSPRVPAVAFCHGTPMRSELEARGSDVLTDATERATAALAARFGPGAVEGALQALVVTAERGAD